jgi:MFS family permease
MSKLAQSRKIFELILLILAAGSIYPLVYLRQTFETTILELFQINQGELAGIYMMLGFIFVVGYVPSGWLADRFSVKALIIFSLLLTSAVGVFYAQIPDSSYLIYIFLAWGFATVFTFWSALLKSVHLLADSNEEGRYFGALDGGRGLIEAILASAAIALFAAVAGSSNPDFEQSKTAFQAVVYMYCGIVAATAVALFFLMPNRREEKAADAARDAAQREATKTTLTPIAAVIRILKIREVWVMITVIFCGYTLFWAHYYFSGYLNVNHGASQVGAGVITVIVLWMRPVGGFGGGYLADKLGRSRILSITMLLTAALLIALGVLPGNSPLGFIYALVVIAGLMMYVIRGVYWSLLDEARVPPAAVGIAIGVISFFGYLPDILIPSISGWIYSAFGDNVAGANNFFFIVCAVIGLVGAVSAMYFTKLMKRREIHETGAQDTALQTHETSGILEGESHS